MYFFIKRIVDIVISLVAVTLLSPIFIATALIVYIQDFNNPIFTSLRLGENKQEFNFYKFRSMVKDAFLKERQDAEVMKNIRGGTNKMENHPYVTTFGKFIRKYSIDELPQFFNVLKGDMSVVGPRALYEGEINKFLRTNPDYKKYVDIIYTAKPGITGYWQVNGRNNILFDERLKMEAAYIKRRNTLSDLIVILKTPYAVFKGETS